MSPGLDHIEEVSVSKKTPRYCTCTCSGREFATVTNVHKIGLERKDCDCHCPCHNLWSLNLNTRESGNVKEELNSTDSLLTEILQNVESTQKNEKALRAGCRCVCSASGCKCVCGRTNYCNCGCVNNDACTCTCTCSRASPRDVWFKALESINST